MSRRCRSAAAALLRGLAGPAALCLGSAMSLCGAPAACAAGPAGGGGGGGFSAARLSPPWLRLPEVPGAEPHRTNELLLLPPPAPRGPAPSPQHHVVYFPGDVQVRCERAGGERWGPGGRSGEAAPEGRVRGRAVRVGIARLLPRPSEHLAVSHGRAQGTRTGPLEIRAGAVAVGRRVVFTESLRLEITESSL